MHAIQIGIVGSGKVAQTLLRLANAAGIPIAGIYARNQALAEQLAAKYNTQCVAQLSELHSELILLCVSDDALPEIIAQLKPQQIAAYTAGSPSIKLFAHQQLGVCYPYQSISKGRDLLVSDIPFMIEGKNDLVLQRISTFLQQLGAQFQVCGSAQRAQYHLAGVFVNNFGNLLLLEASKILGEANLDMTPIYPLLNETIAKAILLGPEHAQTGPALRHDQNTLDRHRAALNPEQLVVYNCLTKRIQDLFPHA
ncbi:MAG: hypothetical protein RL762_367 [Bacteroidota bacterium]|jgi:predicted short-subunit dehydrogenase-like oxidoreductase (DUF2520 family)